MEITILTLLLILCVLPKLNTELVQISQGVLNGTTEISRSGRTYSAFLGIPYGEPPIGNLRFRNPVRAKKWKGVRQADTFGNKCYHTILGFETFGEEDCLYLNVYTPLLNFKLQSQNGTNGHLLPVMVWIHGGAFFLGSGDTYGANYLLDKDVILVTFNYRLGIFGFFTTGDLEAPGNFGLKDQNLALKWVQENIEAFGGDPGRVTIFGQSAGGASVQFHALSKASDGLFQQYIMQSGLAVQPWAYYERSKLSKLGQRAAVILLCPTSSTKSLINCMRRRSAKSLLIASNIIKVVRAIGQFTWVPTNEPVAEDAFLTDNPNNLLNQMKDLPFMSGVVKEEGKVFTFPLYLTPISYLPVRIILKKIFLKDVDFKLNTNKTFVKKLQKFYLNDSFGITISKKKIDGYTKLLTDGLFIYPNARMLRNITPKMKNPNYLYSFGCTSTISVMPYFMLKKENIGVDHAVELFFLFPLHYGPMNSSEINFSPENIKLSHLMVDLWTSFAANGTPTSSKLKVKWKPYETRNTTHLQICDIDNNLNSAVTLSKNFYTDRMDFWRRNTSP